MFLGVKRISKARPGRPAPAPPEGARQASAAIFGLVAREGVDLGLQAVKVAMIQRGSMIDGYAIGVNLKILKI